MSENKVKFNLKNVHFAPIVNGKYSTPFALKGAVSLSLDPQGDIEKFYADGIVYYQSAPNNGYEGDLEFALITDEFREKIFNEAANTDGVAVENINNVFNDFALGFEVDGDVKGTKFWYYNCTATRPSQSASTSEDSKSPETEKLEISCTCDENGNVRAKTTSTTTDSILSAWFDSVYEPTTQSTTSSSSGDSSSGTSTSS